MFAQCTFALFADVSFQARDSDVPAVLTMAGRICRLIVDHGDVASARLVFVDAGSRSLFDREFPGNGSLSRSFCMYHVLSQSLIHRDVRSVCFCSQVATTPTVSWILVVCLSHLVGLLERRSVATLMC